MRVTHTMLFRSSLADVDSIASDGERLLRQAGTGRRFSRVSEDPAGSARMLRLRGEIGRENALLDSLKVGIDNLKNVELALDEGIQVLHRAKELGIQAATGARADADFEAIASEAEHLLRNMVTVGNLKIGERFVFSGTESFTQPFEMVGDPPTAVTYHGNSDSRTIRPSPGVEFDANLPGNEVFQAGTDVFDALIRLRDAARAHDVEALAGAVGAGLDEAMNQLIDVRTNIGTVQAGLERGVELIEQTVLQNEATLSETEDVDLVETLTNLQLLENRRTSALQTAARIIQPSLMDYLA